MLLKCSASWNSLVLCMSQLGVFKVTYKARVSGESTKWGWTARGKKTLVFKCMSLTARTQGITDSASTREHFESLLQGLAAPRPRHPAVRQTWGKGASARAAPGPVSDPGPPSSAPGAVVPGSAPGTCSLAVRRTMTLG